jgi:hypothetical protein
MGINQEPSPKQVSEKYSELVESVRDSAKIEDLTKKSLFDKRSNGNRVMNLMISSADTDDEYLEAINLIPEGYDDGRLKELGKEQLERIGLEELKNQAAKRLAAEDEMTRSQASRYMDLRKETQAASEAASEYAENNIAQLQTAALADAALEGVQINHPDAIEVNKDN